MQHLGWLKGFSPVFREQAGCVGVGGEGVEGWNKHLLSTYYACSEPTMRQGLCLTDTMRKGFGARQEVIWGDWAGCHASPRPACLPLPAPHTYLTTDILKFEVKFTEHKINHVQVYNSMAFSTFRAMCDHSLYQVLKHFPQPKRTPCARHSCALLPTAPPSLTFVLSV